MKFSNPFSKKVTKHFLIGSEVVFNGDSQSYNFLRTQAVEKLFAKEDNDGLELVFKDGLLIEKHQWMYGERDPLELSDEEKSFQLKEEVLPNDIFAIKLSQSKSESFLGGTEEKEFNLPKFSKKPSFQYLGKLSNKTHGFEWLPFDLNLTIPLYGYFNQLFLDYSDKNNPRVVNESEYLNSDYDDKYVNSSSQVIFEKTYISTEKLNEHRELEWENGIIGIPKWIQYPAIPTCPKTGEMMKFICQFSYQINVPVFESDLDFNSDSIDKSYYEKMNFGSDGDLFIFMNPNTKIVCYIIQHT